MARKFDSLNRKTRAENEELYFSFIERRSEINRTTNAEIIRIADKGRWKNTEALPWPIAMDCRKLVSIIGLRPWSEQEALADSQVF